MDPINPIINLCIINSTRKQRKIWEGIGLPKFRIAVMLIRAHTLVSEVVINFIPLSSC